MKTMFFSLVALALLTRASAQVALELSEDQEEYLPHEAVRLTIKVSNTSGQTLHLGADPDWLTFTVESDDQFIVAKNSDVPVVDPFDLDSSQRAIEHVDLQPHFQIDRPGRYKVTASMHIKPWGLTVNSAPLHFDIIHGGEIWSQGFGVTRGTNVPPESRRYTLIKANYLREQLRLYFQVSSGDGQIIYKVASLGPLVSFSWPEEQLDQFNQLHILWQTGAQSFSYVIVGVDGGILSRDTYDEVNSRPRLVVTRTGEAEIVGGVRRPRPDEIPPVKPSNVPPAAVPLPATASK